MDATALEDKLRALLENTSPADLVAVYLFGSRARGDFPTSDVDLGVLLAATPPTTLRGTAPTLEAAIEAALGLPVEVVVLNTAPPDLVHRVLRDGKLVLDRDRSARIHFEVKARNELFDLQPVLRRYRRAGPGAP